MTPKGRATRQRIVSAAADLIFERGVAGTSIEDVRRAAGVSGSQVSHYFAEKRSLVRAVIAWQIDTVVELQELPVLGRLDSFQSLDMWAELNIAQQKRLACRGGCRLGSLAGELAEQDPEIRADLAAGFDRCVASFRSGLRLMRQRGDLRPDADPDDLAVGLLSAFEGGMLLSRTYRDIRMLEASLKAVLAYIRSFATNEAERMQIHRKPGLSRRAGRLVDEMPGKLSALPITSD